jgi:hypothetical protein
MLRLARPSAVITELLLLQNSMCLSEDLDCSVDEARPELVDSAGKGDGPIGSQEERLVLVQEACLAEFPNPWRAGRGPKDLEELVDGVLQVIWRRISLGMVSGPGLCPC